MPLRVFFRFFGLVLVSVAWTASLATAQEGEFPDELVRWSPIPANPVFTGAGGDAWDQKIRERGWITFEDGTWHLFYTGFNPEKSPRMKLGHATSPDGLHWRRDPKNPVHDSSWVEDMCVVKQGGTYYMIAEGEKDVAHLLTSTDLEQWTEHGPLDIRLSSGEPISAGPRGTPFAFVEDGTWYLLYERRDQGVWLATSKDHKVWTNVQDEPVLKLGPDAYDATAIAVNQVVKRDGVYYAIYHNKAPAPSEDWNTCLARSTDLIHWDKYARNPVVTHDSSSGILVDPDGDDGPIAPKLYTMHPEVRVYVHTRDMD